MSWTEAKTERLKTLWQEGKSASEIARILGHVSRNAVIGKVSRLGRQGRETPHRPAARPAKAKAARSAAHPIAVHAKPRVRTQAATQAIELRSVINRVIDPSTSRLTDYAALAEGVGVDILDLADNGCRLILGKAPNGHARYCGCRTERKGARFEPYCGRHSNGKSDLSKTKARPTPRADLGHFRQARASDYRMGDHG